MKIANFPGISLAEAGLMRPMLKQVRRQGRCPASEAKGEKPRERQPVQNVAQWRVASAGKRVERYLRQPQIERLEGTDDRHRYAAECGE